MTCEHCGAVFCWDGADQVFLGGDERKRYCSQACKRNAKNKRHDLRGSHIRRLSVCAGQGKQRWTDEHAASLAAARWEQQFGSRRYPYECACGWWHITKVPPGAHKRAADIKRILFGASA
jgi:hypothetical protein